MKKETKIIIIGAAITLLVLVLAIFIFYLIAKDTPKNNEDNPVAEKNNIEQKTDTNSTPTANKDNTEANTSDNSSKNTVTIYLFRGEGCHFCENAIEFFEGITDEYAYLDVKAYEVWRNTENRKLMNAVANELDIKVSTSVPLIIIGDEYAERGFSERRGEMIIEELENAHHSNSYTDIVEKVLKENNFNVTVEEIN